MTNPDISAMQAVLIGVDDPEAAEQHSGSLLQLV